MKNSQIEIYDTTLRDGLQQQGLSVSVNEKILITQALDSIGVDVIEGGYIGSTKNDNDYFISAKQLNLKNSLLAGFTSTRKAKSKVSEATFLIESVELQLPIITLVGKSSKFHVENVIKTTKKENLEMIFDSVNFLNKNGIQTFFDAEHFFDGYSEDPEYSISVLKSALNAGAERVILCDTNGGTMPTHLKEVVETVINALDKDVKVGIHAHNDTDNAVANSLLAFEAGAFQIQACINGYGERTGNANLCSIIASLKTKYGVDCVTNEQLKQLTQLSNYVADIFNRRLNPFQAYVGSSAFAHKGGLHAAATLRNAQAYQHIDPTIVGNSSNITVSSQSGKGNITHYLKNNNFSELLPQVAEIASIVKENEAKGITYENADASLYLLLRKLKPDYTAPFKLEKYSVNYTYLPDTNSEVCEATVKVRVGECLYHKVAEGEGPVDALNHALRDALTIHYSNLAEVKLNDYKVRIINDGRGTAALTRVIIESRDSKQTWVTVGAAANIITASYAALCDSIEWWLVNNS